MLAPSTFWPLAAMMFAAGLGIPILATLNAQLGVQLGNPAGATLILFLASLTLCAAITLTIAPPIELAKLPLHRPWLFTAAVFMVFYALSITYAAPRIGVGNAVFFVLLGQLVAAAAVDHFGLLGAIRFGMTGRRAVGMAVMALGVYLAKRGG
jgi:transporter family-2 protein